MPQLSKNIERNLQGQTSRELFQLQAQSLLKGHPFVSKLSPENSEDHRETILE